MIPSATSYNTDHVAAMDDDRKQERTDHSSGDEFARLSDQPAPSLLQEIVGLISHNKKWWLIPLVVTLMPVAAMIFLGSTPAAPFIYTLF